MRKKPVVKEAFFETLTHWHRPVVAWYLLRGYRVHVFDFTYRLKQMAWLRRLILEERVDRIYTQFSRGDGMALDAAEWLYPKLSSCPLLRSVGALFGSEESDGVFKSSLVDHLLPYFFMRFYFEGLPQKKWAVLISESIRRWGPALRDWAPGRSSGLEGIRQPLLPCLASQAVAFCKKIFQYWPRYLALGLYAVYAGACSRFRAGRAGRRSKPEQQTLCLYAVSSPFQMKRSGTRRFDFLLDHQRLTRENTAFLLDPGGDRVWAEKVRAEGYRVFQMSDYTNLGALLWDPPESVPWKRVVSTLLRALRALTAGRWVHEAAQLGLVVLLRESRFLEQVHFEQYIYANQYGLVPRWRNVLLRKAGRVSWWFAYSTGGGFLYWKEGMLRGDNEHGGRHHYWAYQNPDHFVSPCAPLIGYHREHRQRIRFYHDVGNLWSGLILREEQRGQREELRRAWFGKQVEGRKIVAWFDTTFVEAPNSPSTFTEAVQGYKDILRLVEEREDLLVVIKPSKKEDYYVSERADQQWSAPKKGREVLEALSALRDHSRVRLFPNSEDPNLVILGSDLTVTFCFSAVSAEALGAGKKAIWYEPGQRWRETFLGKDPLLTAHGYEELRWLVQKHLYEMEGEAYQRFLDHSVRGPVDSFIDGNGLSRFRDFLTGQVKSPARAQVLISA